MCLRLALFKVSMGLRRRRPRGAPLVLDPANRRRPRHGRDV